MAVTLKDFRDYNGTNYFTVSIDGTDIKDCRVVKGQKGDFVSGPAKKIQKNGKDEWINLIWFSKEHQAEILRLVAAAPAAKPAPPVDDSNIPF